MRVAVVSLGFALCSCGLLTGGGPNGGPLQDNIDSNGVMTLRGCGEPGDEYSFGDAIENNSDDPMVVTDARFKTVKGMTTLGIMRISFASNGNNVGAMPEYPPKNFKPARWAQADPLTDSSIESGELLQLVLGFRLDAERGVAKGLIVTYEIRGRQYEAKYENSFKMRGRC